MGVLARGMPPDVMLIQCDTARADAFRPWGASHRTPNLERLCERGRWFGQAHAAAPWTLASTASIFSGRLPTEHGVTGECFELREGGPTSPANAVRGVTAPWLPERFGELGYRTWAASSNTWISRWGGFDRGFDSFLDIPVEPGNKARRAGRISGLMDWGGRRTVREFERVVRDGSRPLFAYVNLMEVHAPYDPPLRYHPAVRRPAGAPPWRALLRFQLRQRRLRSTPTPAYVAAVRALYMACARYEDALVGRLVRAAERTGRPTVVAVVSDHGEHLGEHGLFAHHSSLHQTLVHVPLVLWATGLDIGRGRVEEPVSLLGVPGWLLAVAEGEVQESLGAGAVISEYESTARHMGLPPELRTRVDANDPDVPPLTTEPGLAVRRGRLKFVTTESGAVSLFDVTADPGEQHDLAAQEPGRVTEFLPDRAAWLARRAGRPRYAVGEEAEAEIAEHLQALGYID